MNLLKNFKAEAIIFDKDGTLIDFDAMWGGWTIQLTDRLQKTTGLDIREKLCSAFGYDLQDHKIISDGKITCTPMWELREIMIETIMSLGVSHPDAELATDKAWHVPDPVSLAKPFTNLKTLFENIHKIGIKIAIATTDDRAPTEAMMKTFGLEQFISTMVCADDGIPAKPAPDMINTICTRLAIHPSRVIMIGDTVADMKMGRSANAGMLIGVLSGVGSLENLTPLADILIDSIDTIQGSFVINEATIPILTSDGLTDLNPDVALA